MRVLGKQSLAPNIFGALDSNH